MRTITAKKLTVQDFHPYGDFVDLMNPDGFSLGDFYRDKVMMNLQGGMQMAFSPLVVHKTEKMIVSQAEYHDTAQEAVLCLDDDTVMHVAPASNVPVPELTEAFIIPKGTLVRLHLGMWHLALMPIHEETAHVLIVLPERIYHNDCKVVTYPEDQQIEIVLP